MSDHTEAERGEGQVDRVCHDEQMTIWTGEIVGSLSMGGYFRERLSYDDGLHIHAVIARDLRSIIASAFLQAEPPAQCDEPPQGRDRNGLGGDSPAGAMAEGQAPANNTMSKLTAHSGSDDAVSEIPTLKAEIERLKAQSQANLRLLTSALQYVAVANTALAESERKRVEAASAGRMLIAAEDARRAAIAAFNAAWDEQPAPPTQKQVSAERAAIQGADIAHQRALLRALAAIRALATPTQETPHVES